MKLRYLSEPGQYQPRPAHQALVANDPQLLESDETALTSLSLLLPIVAYRLSTATIGVLFSLKAKTSSRMQQLLPGRAGLVHLAWVGKHKAVPIGDNS